MKSRNRINPSWPCGKGAEHMTMLADGKLYIGTSRKPDDSISKGEYLDLRFGNRHGLITGATGTGKTVTLQILAEGFANAGVPVFCADVKGDLSGIAAKGQPKDFLDKRAKDIGLDDYAYQKFPAIFWDLFGERGHRMRATLTEMGPLLLSRMMDASDAQEGIINIAFKIADEGALPLLDLKDFQALLGYMSENAGVLSKKYGLVSTSSVGAIQRQLLILEQQGAESFFGEPALKISDLMRTTYDGRGYISVMAAEKLMMSPRLYATFLLWLLSELFEELPEIGDPEKPKLVFFFDEAHLLFKDAPKILLQRIEQVVRLIRSKGVGVFFVTQNPADVPDTVLAQLGNRVQHALRAYSPNEQKAVKVAADTFRPNPDFNCADVIANLGTGEALVSTLEGKGTPSIVQRTLIRPPASKLGPVTDDELAEVLSQSPIDEANDTDIDRESAYEMLAAKAQSAEDKVNDTAPPAGQPGERPKGRWTLPGFGESEPEAPSTRATKPASRRSDTVVETVMKSAARSVTTAVTGAITRAIVRGILGSMKK
jgi:uncharacterized protein